MHEAETRALRRAAALLVLISILRWGWSERGRTPAVDGGTVLPELLAASREAAKEAERRGAPLGQGERVDPNTADDVELDRLPGIGPSTARAIVAAREGGALFRSPEDLLSVRGIGTATLDRIRESLSLSDAPSGSDSRRSAVLTPSSVTAPPGPVDVNRADLRGLMSLPGVGPAIAERILVARREQAFTSLEDLVRVRGIGPATVERLRPHASVSRQPPR